MEDRKIKAILFDMSGVLASDGFKLAIRKYERLNKIKSGRVYEAASQRDIWTDYSLGRISENEYFQKIEKRLGETIDFEVLSNFIKEGMTPNSEVLDFIRTLSLTHSLGVVSNTPKDWFEYFFQKNKLEELFKVKITSAYLGIRKPDRGIFEEAVRRLKVNPSEVIYVDDHEDMTREAANLGINIIVYTDIRKLRKDLLKFHVQE